MCGHRSARLLGGTEANFWRIISAAIMLAVWAYSFGTGLEGPALPLFALSGAIGIGMGDVASFQSLPRLGPRLSSLVVLCLTAPFGALIEWVWMGTKLTSWQAGWGAVILGGVVIALVPSGKVRRTAREWGGWSELRRGSGFRHRVWRRSQSKGLRSDRKLRRSNR